MVITKLLLFSAKASTSASSALLRSLFFCIRPTVKFFRAKELVPLITASMHSSL